jgi:hypothetical protein
MVYKQAWSIKNYRCVGDVFTTSSTGRGLVLATTPEKEYNVF